MIRDCLLATLLSAQAYAPEVVYATTHVTQPCEQPHRLAVALANHHGRDDTTTKQVPPSGNMTAEWKSVREILIKYEFQLSRGKDM